MSGQQIGTVVGGVIGAYFGNPQLGAMIGGMIGGAVDPTKTYGPRLTDAQNQTAMDGVTRAYGDGTFPCKGNLIWQDIVKEHKHTDDGKGSGQEQITYTYTRSYAIGVCKGPISGYKIIKRNGKIVFDARTDAELSALGYTAEQIAESRAAQAKFRKVCTLYYGTAEQLPDPTIVAVKGVGNVPAYAGTAYIVLTDDETMQGEVAQYEFVVANCGDRTEDDIDYIPVKWDEATETGGTLDLLGSGHFTVRGASNQAGFITADRFVNSGDWYWETTTGWYLYSGSGINHFGSAGVIRASDAAYGLALSKIGETNDGGAVSPGDTLFNPETLYSDWVPPPNTPHTALLRNRLTFTEGGATWSVAVDDGEWNVIMFGMPGTFAPYACSRGTSQDPTISEKDVTIYSMPDDFTYEVPEDALPLSAAPLSIGIPLPDAPGYYVDPETGEIIGPGGMTISVCTPTLGSIVSKQCAKRVSTDVIDVSELTDLVTGFRVAAPSSPQKNIGALMPGYFFDGSEYDGKLRFPRRGGEDSFSLTVDDLCEREGDLIQWERTQEPELLRKLTVGYLDPDTTYTATTQQWERRSGTVLAQGEGTIELPIVGSKDWAAQAAHMNGKVAWGESDKCTFHTSIEQAKLVTAAVGTITDEAGTIHRVRIERIEDEGLVRMVEARRTRADLYESTVSGAAKPLPLFPGSNIRGPTDGLLLNLPVIVDANDVPGIAWAASGYLSGWAGTTLQFQRAGQWVDAGTVTLPATMGTLLAALPAHAGDVDNTNTLSVRMNDSLESVTFTNLLQERNPLAILYPDGTAEIVQFQTATEVAAGEYDLTTLIRGRLNTVRGAHAVGARVVFLDNSVQYATLQPTDVGTTLTYRFVPLGTDPDAAPVLAMDLDTMQSQTEWPVDSLAVEQDGDDFILTWLARDRLGTDVFPIRSTNWRGYEVSWSYGGDTHTETVLTETATFNLPGASDITFSVAQLNLYTGAGPAQTVSIP